MQLYNSSKDYLYNLYASSSSEAKRMWRQSIKDKWGRKCAYCGETKHLTIDHVIPQCKGGLDLLENLVCCCKDCNGSKGHEDWKEWYSKQEFFTQERYDVIIEWVETRNNKNLYRYKKRRNDAS